MIKLVFSLFCLPAAVRAQCSPLCAPGSLCSGTTCSPCSVGYFCVGGTAPAVACLTPALCPIPGLYAEPIFWNVTTFAGRTSPNTPFADGSAATFTYPAGLALGASGQLYVADSYYHRVRVITPLGNVSTLAGGIAGWVDALGTAARFNRPWSFALLPSGSLYVADANNHRIRLVTAPEGNTTTYAGSGSATFADGTGTLASFNYPRGLALDAAGNLFVADANNHCIRHITPSRVVTVLAGKAATPGFYNGVGAAAAFRYPEGLALAANGDLYVGDWDNNRIRLLRPSSAAVSTYAGSGSGDDYGNGFVDGLGLLAVFSCPSQITLSPLGELLVCDSCGSHRVRRVATSSYATTIAGGGFDFAASGYFNNGFGTAAAFWEPRGVAFEPSNSTLYISDHRNHLIRKLIPTLCPASFFCPPLSLIPLLCPAGNYCPFLSLMPTLCAAGTFSSTPGASSPTTCQGCPIGSYCPAGSRIPIPCPAGRFGSAPNLSLPACSGDCTSAPGQGCPAGSTSDTPSACKVGFFCPGGTPAPATPCNVPLLCNVEGLVEEPACIWTVSTLIGGGLSALNNGVGTIAAFGSPRGSSLDDFGQLFIADTSNHRIRVLSPDGYLANFAGSGWDAHRNGLAARAAFDSPVHLLWDVSGSIFVTDYGNHRVRVINPDGFVHNFAGNGYATWADGVGWAASFNCPWGISSDLSGTLFIADHCNNRIRIVSSSGHVTTLAGTGVAGFANGVGTSSARFNGPLGVSVDASGSRDVFVAEYHNNRIRRITPLGVVTSLAGGGPGPWADGIGTTAGLSGPHDVLFTPNGDIIFADKENSRLRQVSPRGFVSTLAGNARGYRDGTGTAALFNKPQGFSRNANGTIFLSDTENFRVRMLTCMRCPVANFCPSGIALQCPSGSFCPGGAFNKMPCPAGTYSTAPGGASASDCLICPRGSFCPPGSTSPTPCPAGFYGSSEGLPNATCSAPCAAPPGYGCAAGSTSAGDATLCAPGFFCPGGTPAPSTPCTNAQSCSPPGLTAEPSCIWNVTVVAGGGTASFVDGVGSSATFRAPRGIALGTPGMVFVADTSNNVIRQVLTSGVTSTLAGNGGAAWGDGTGFGSSFSSPYGLAGDPSSEDVYVADTGNHRVRRVTPSGVVTTVAGNGIASWSDGEGTLSMLRSPQGIAVTSAGIVFVADTGNHRIRMISPSGTTTTLAGTGLSSPFSDGMGTSTASFSSPAGLAVGLDGNVYVGDSGNNRIRVVSALGEVSTFAGSGAAGWVDASAPLSAAFSGPTSLSFLPNGNLLVADTATNRVRAITPLGVVFTVAGGGAAAFANGFGSSALFSAPFGLAAGNGAAIFLGDTGNHRVRSVACAMCSASFYCPSGVPLLCPMGSYCLAYSSAPTPCPANTYASFAGASSSASCTPCPADTFSNPGSAVCCPLGAYAAPGVPSCTACTVGRYSSTPGATSAAACLPCPAGYACPTIGTSTPAACAPGTNSSQLAGVCCGLGFWSASGSTTCNPCAAGSSTNGVMGGNTSASCMPCPAGTRCPTAGTPLPLPCSAGTDSSSGAGVCCPMGAWAAPGTTACTPCTYNTYSITRAATSPAACLACGASLFSSLGASVCCPIGAWATPSTTLCNLCPSGSYSSTVGAAAFSSCTPCPAGTWSGSPGSPSLALCSPCTPGRFCPSNTSTPRNCPQNTYNVDYSSTSASACKSCPNSTYSAAGSSICLSIGTTSCSGGTYVDAASATLCSPCPAGTFSSLATTFCTPCAAGYFSGQGALACERCPRGSWCSGGLPYECPAGTYGSNLESTDASACTPCPQGTSNSAMGSMTSAACFTCPSGTFSSTGATACSLCPPGTASAVTGAFSNATCEPCELGAFNSLPGQGTCAKYCPKGMRGVKLGGRGLEEACANCTVGSFSAFSGSVSCEDCPPGTFSSAPGSYSCTSCPAGSFSTLGAASALSDCTPCPAGTFSSASGSTACYSCPPGTASSSVGASNVSTCTQCSPGTYAPFSASTACASSPAGTFAGPGASVAQPCPLGTFRSALGGVSAGDCEACPYGKTTIAPGAQQSTQCISVPFTCPAGKQPSSAAAVSLEDCSALSCPPPLRPSAYAATSGFSSDASSVNKSLFCLGCPTGAAGSPPSCLPCAPSEFCPGLTSRPLWNFSASSSSAPSAGSGGRRSLALRASPYSACPLLTLAAAGGRAGGGGADAALASASLLAAAPAATDTSPMASFSSALFGSNIPKTAAQSLFAWLLVFSFLFFCATAVVCCSGSRASSLSSAAILRKGLLYLPAAVLRTLDIFSLSHKVSDKSPLIKESTTLGGLFSLMAFTTLLTYSAYMVATWLQDNTLVQQSLATMDGDVWASVEGLPWVASPLAPLVLRLTLDGEPGACAAPLSFSTSGLLSGAFSLQSTADCGGSGVAQHTLLCKSCHLSAKTKVYLEFHYSCQSMLLEALGSRPFPAPATLSSQVAPPDLTAAAPKGGAFLLSSLTWSLNLVLNVLNDTTTTTGSIGWHIAEQQLTPGAPFSPMPFNGSLSLLPTSSSVSVTFALSLASTYASTILSARVPLTQLLANIVGLGGMLSMFGLAFSYFEQYCKGRACTRPKVLTTTGTAATPPSPPTQAELPLDGGGMAPVAPPAAPASSFFIQNPLHAQRSSIATLLKGTPHAILTDAAPSALLMARMDALEAAHHQQRHLVVPSKGTPPSHKELASLQAQLDAMATRLRIMQRELEDKAALQARREEAVAQRLEEVTHLAEGAAAAAAVAEVAHRAAPHAQLEMVQGLSGYRKPLDGEEEGAGEGGGRGLQPLHERCTRRASAACHLGGIGARRVRVGRWFSLITQAPERLTPAMRSLFLWLPLCALC